MLKSKVAIVICAFAAASFAGAQTSDPQSDPVYQRLSKIVGGVWHGTGPNVNVESSWKIAPDGVSIECTTVIRPTGAPVMHSMARFGWDPIAKQVYYLDAHDHQTVYFGHAEMKGEDIEVKFKSIVGEASEWLFSYAFSGENAFKATLFPIVNGKQAPQLFALDWKRQK